MQVERLALEKKMYSGYDEKRGVPIADLKRLRREVRRAVEEGGSGVVLLDGHYAHDLIAATAALGVFVMRLDPLNLYRRSVRLHTEGKARENSLSEFLGKISFEARRNHDRVVDLDVTGLSVNDVSVKLMNQVRRRFTRSTPPIDWMKIMSERRIRRFLSVVEDEVPVG